MDSESTSSTMSDELDFELPGSVAGENKTTTMPPELQSGDSKSSQQQQQQPEPETASDESTLEVPLAKLKLKDLSKEDREAVEYLRATSKVFEHVYTLVARSSKKWHEIASRHYHQNGGANDGRGFVVVYVTDVNDLLKNGPQKDAVQYVTYSKALAQVVAAKKDPKKPQVQIPSDMARMIQTYDPSKEFLLQVMIVLIPLKDQHEASLKEGKDAKDNTEPLSVASSEAWKQPSTKMLSKVFKVRANTEDTYTDELQGALRKERRNREEKEKQKQAAQPQPMQTGATEGKASNVPSIADSGK